MLAEVGVGGLIFYQQLVQMEYHGGEGGGWLGMERITASLARGAVTITVFLLEVVGLWY